MAHESSLLRMPCLPEVVERSCSLVVMYAWMPICCSGYRSNGIKGDLSSQCTGEFRLGNRDVVSHQVCTCFQSSLRCRHRVETWTPCNPGWSAISQPPKNLEEKLCDTPFHLTTFILLLYYSLPYAVASGPGFCLHLCDCEVINVLVIKLRSVDNSGEFFLFYRTKVA